MKGILCQTDNGWVIAVNGKILPLHPSDHIIAYNYVGKEVEFEVETIAVGTSEFDILDCDVVKLVF